MMERPPVPAARTTAPGARPVPRPRRILPEAAPPVAPRRLRDQKRLSKEVPETTKEKIERGILSTANLARNFFEQDAYSRRSGIQLEIPSNNNEKSTQNQLKFKEKPTELTTANNNLPLKRSSIPSDMALFGTIKFHSPIVEEEPKFVYNDNGNEAEDFYKIPSTSIQKPYSVDNLSQITKEFEETSKPTLNSYDEVRFSTSSINNTYENNGNENTPYKVESNKASPSLSILSNITVDSNTEIDASNLSISSKSDTPRSSGKNSPVIMREPTKRSSRPVPPIPVVKDENIVESFFSPNLQTNIDSLTPEIVPIASTSTSESPTPLYRKKIGSNPNRPSSSTIFEFDPLMNRRSVNSKKGNELSMMKSLLDDNYSRLHSIDDDLSNEMDFDLYMDHIADCAMPPLPPERFDSLNEVGTPPPPYTPRESQTFWHINNFDDDTTNESKKKITAESLIKQSNVKLKKTLSFFKKSSSETVSNIRKRFDDKSTVSSRIEKPVLKSNSLYYEGPMTRLLSGAIDELFKNFQMRLCSLKNNSINCYADMSPTAVKDTYNLENLYSIQLIFSNNLDSEIKLHCFKMTFKSSGTFTNNRTSVVFGCSSKNERNIWLLKIMGCITDVFPENFLIDMTRFGWCYIKENISRDWQSGWLLLCRRALYYWTPQETKMQYLDLRKARCVVLQKDEDNVAEEGPNIILDFPDKTFYIKMGHSEETKVWRKIIYNVASGNGTWLYRQQLTKDDVPTLVIKCINFIYAEGSLTEFIYRRTGAVTSVSAILEEFKKDAWAVQLSPRTHNPYDVATALKRFFRELPESILAAEIQEKLLASSEIKNVDDKVLSYQNALRELHPISQNTLKKLFGHLHFIQSFSDDNLMTSENLGAIWGPALMFCNPQNSKIETMSNNIVVRDLINLYIPIYCPSLEELQKEKLMQKVLLKYQNTNLTIPHKPTGDFHIWIYLGHKSPETSVNITLRVGMTAAELCSEHSLKLKMEPHDLLIEEVICEDSLRRPLHHSEILLDVVFRWGYWDEMDRKDNYLLIKNNSLVREAVQSITSLSGHQNFSKELKFAGEKSKTFKTISFHFSQGTLTCFKDKFGTSVLNSWKMEDIIWYIGYETKRNPQSNWAITIISRNSKSVRSKDKPNFGSIIAGSEKADFINLIGMMMYAEHEGLILPGVQFIVP